MGTGLLANSHSCYYALKSLTWPAILHRPDVSTIGYSHPQPSFLPPVFPASPTLSEHVGYFMSTPCMFSPAVSVWTLFPIFSTSQRNSKRNPGRYHFLQTLPAPSCMPKHYNGSHLYHLTAPLIPV